MSTGDVLLNALPHAILVLGPGDRVLQCNAAAEDLFQTSLTHLRRLALNDLVSFSSALASLVAQVRRTGNSVNEYGVELASPRALDNRLVDIYGARLPDAPDRVLIILQQRNMAAMIERQMTHRAAARSVSSLAAMLAHEIKNPLSGIRGAAQLIEPSLDDDGRALTRLICSETDRICGLVDRMQVFGDDRPIPPGTINIHSVLGHVKSLAEKGFARGITIEEQYDPSLPEIRGDRDRLIQAVLNLVKNAAEAVSGFRGDGLIVLRTAYRPGLRLSLPGTRERIFLPLMIAIEDNGPGIPDDVRGHLFDPFFTTKPSGSGLGLALVAKIVADHEGIIECDSEAGRTVFRLLLPVGSGTS
ncbi:MAG: two-component sensor histidine kinase [Rhizobiales bacterium]|nr:two-component sensor histidine kinase [Hyphomicrobiales bacterium]